MEPYGCRCRDVGLQLLQWRFPRWRKLMILRGPTRVWQSSTPLGSGGLYRANGLRASTARGNEGRGVRALIRLPGRGGLDVRHSNQGSRFLDPDAGHSIDSLAERKSRRGHLACAGGTTRSRRLRYDVGGRDAEAAARLRRPAERGMGGSVLPDLENGTRALQRAGRCARRSSWLAYGNP